LIAIGFVLGSCCIAHADVRQVFNVRDFGARGDAQTDDSAAIARAAALAASAASDGRGAELFFPSGIYRLVAPLPIFVTPVSLMGDGHAQSVILVDPAFSGDVFSWSEIRDPDNQDAHARIEIGGSRVVGDRRTPNIQNAFVFYDRVDGVVMTNVDVFYMTGRALSSGFPRRTAAASLTEARFDGLRFFNCASPGIPAVDFHTQGGERSTADVSVNALDIFAPFGPGVLLHSDGAPLRNLRFSKLRIEGLQNGTTAADLLQIGDVSEAGAVEDIDFEEAELVDPYPSFSAIRFTGATLATAPSRIHFEGLIGGGLPHGQGLSIDAGRELSFDFTGIHTFGVNVAVASSATVGGFVLLNGFGQEAGWTRSIDPSSAAIVQKPVLEQF
jgi:hypothetical protein